MFGNIPDRPRQFAPTVANYRRPCDFLPVRPSRPSLEVGPVRLIVIGFDFGPLSASCPNFDACLPEMGRQCCSWRWVRRRLALMAKQQSSDCFDFSSSRIPDAARRLADPEDFRRHGSSCLAPPGYSMKASWNSSFPSSNFAGNSCSFCPFDYEMAR